MKKFKLLAGLFILASLVIIPSSVQAFSLNDFFSPPIGFLTQVREKVEYAFAFSNEKKTQLLNKQAERRLERAQEQAQAGDEKSVGALVEDYKNIKGKQGELVEKASDNNDIKNQIKNSTIDEQEAIKTIVENVSVDTVKQVIDIDREVITDIQRRVVVEGGEISREQFEKSVSVVWAEGTGPNEVISGDKNSEKNNIEVVGGLPEYAPGTSAGGESQREIKGGVKNEVKVMEKGK